MSLTSTQPPPPPPSLSPHPSSTQPTSSTTSKPTHSNTDSPIPPDEQNPTSIENITHPTNPPQTPPSPPSPPKQTPSRRHILETERALAQVESRLRTFRVADIATRERHVEELGDAYSNRLAGYAGDNAQRAIASYAAVCAWMRKRGEHVARVRVLVKLGRALYQLVGCVEVMDEGGEGGMRAEVLERAVRVLEEAVSAGGESGAQAWLYGGLVREKIWEGGEDLGEAVREGYLKEWVRWLEKALEGKDRIDGMARVEGMLSLARAYVNVGSTHDGISKAVRLLESVEPVLRKVEEEGREAIQGEVEGMKEEIGRLKEEVEWKDRFVGSRCVIC